MAQVVAVTALQFPAACAASSSAVNEVNVGQPVLSASHAQNREKQRRPSGNGDMVGSR